MKAIALALLLLATMGQPSVAFGQASTPDLLRDFEESRRRANLEIERIERQTREIQAQTDRSNAEFERLRAENERFFREREAEKAAKRAKEAAAEAERAAQKKLEEAQQEKERLVAEMELQAAHTRNYLFATLISVACAALLAHIVRTKRRNPEDAMKYSEKFGVVAMVSSALLIFLALAISSDWQPRLDFFQNVMFSLDIHFFRDEESSGQFLIDIPTRYVIWLLLCTAAYGLLTYLGITPPAWKPKSASGDGTNEPAP